LVEIVFLFLSIFHGILISFKMAFSRKITEEKKSSVFCVMGILFF